MMVSKEMKSAIGGCHVHQKAVVRCFIQYVRIYDLFRDLDDVCCDRDSNQSEAWSE